MADALWGLIARVVAIASFSRLGWVARLVAPAVRVRRGHVRAAMARAGVPLGVAARVYVDLVRGALELLWLSGRLCRDPESARRVVRDRVRLDDASHATLTKELDGGPVVIAASHTANFELASYWLARELSARGRPAAALVTRQGVGAADRFVTSLRRAFGIEPLAPHTGGAPPSRRALEVLRSGGAVAVVIDQAPATAGVTAPFLGAPARVDVAFASLAARAGARVVFVAAHREGADVHVRVLGVAGPPRTAASRVALARRATALLDGFVREHPESWMWLHRRWKAPAVRARVERPRALWGIRAVETRHAG
ncbi:MAG: lysophospholipid acyltransferase family protein [Myxococcales bacterium]|nr:lysophospholipid acyltransferase family protein [Myxococcales bacterium]